ncbi:MAG: hypothetical protein A3F67_05150 [Verrucomicrobia bacterium RIFCSPHIGHO2_12_FULL_41_10]|nr:MAG: hypothetical protein A3F67_05150 [Verrucomicrobia bacterium RIFCSPHIGHO2_12_FULL_41_10]
MAEDNKHQLGVGKYYPNFAPITSNDDFGRKNQPIQNALVNGERNPLEKELGERIPVFRNDGKMYVKIQGKIYVFQGSPLR